MGWPHALPPGQAGPLPGRAAPLREMRRFGVPFPAIGTKATGASCRGYYFRKESPHGTDHQHQSSVAEHAAKPEHDQWSARAGDSAPVERAEGEQRQGRRCRPGDRRTHERAGARHERRDPQRQRRHLAGTGRRRRTGQGRRHAAAHARTRHAVGQRDQQRVGPRQPERRVPRSSPKRSTARSRGPSSTARRSWAPTRVR